MFEFGDLYKITTKEGLIKTARRFGIGVCLILLVTFTLLVYDHFQNPHIGVVNITGIVDEFVTVEAKKAKNNLPPEELKNGHRFLVLLWKKSYTISALKKEGGINAVRDGNSRSQGLYPGSTKTSFFSYGKISLIEG